MNRKIIHIDEDRCNGCGLCVDACHEGALQIADGKARLVKDEYCDGLGDCLPECPTGAIKIIERQAAPFDEALVKQRQAELAQARAPFACGCPHAAGQPIDRPGSGAALSQWPVQLRLVNTAAGRFDRADLVVAADCTAFAHGRFHEFTSGRSTVIGCPKLDDTGLYQRKLAEIISRHSLRSITVVKMEVPCCSVIAAVVKRAMLDAGIVVPYREVTLSLAGETIDS